MPPSDLPAGTSSTDPNLPILTKSHASVQAHEAVMAEKRALFLTEFKRRGNVSQSALAAGVHRRQPYTWKEEDPEFAAQWDDALQCAIDGLEAEAWRRAQEGVQEPVFHKGEICGYIDRYSDALMQTLLKAHKPDKYRENVNVTAELDSRIEGLLEVLAGSRKAEIPREP